MRCANTDLCLTTAEAAIVCPCKAPGLAGWRESYEVPDSGPVSCGLVRQKKIHPGWEIESSQQPHQASETECLVVDYDKNGRSTCLRDAAWVSGKVWNV